MKRIDFLKRLFATGLGVTIAKHVKADSLQPEKTRVNKRYLLSATVAGQQYYEFENVGFKLFGDEDFENSSHSESPEHDAHLLLEPDNPYDFRAVAVYWKDHKMGYLPRKDNKVIYNLLKDGHQLETKLRIKHAFDFDPECDYGPHTFGWDYEMRIRIYLVRKNG